MAYRVRTCGKTYPLSTGQGIKSSTQTSTPARPVDKDPRWDAFSAVRISLVIYAIGTLTYFFVS